jgi:hypothetical protein
LKVEDEAIDVDGVVVVVGVEGNEEEGVEFEGVLVVVVVVEETLPLVPLDIIK